MNGLSCCLRMDRLSRRSGWRPEKALRNDPYPYVKIQTGMDRKSKENLEVSGRLGFSKVVTQIVPAGDFWRAEEEHQRHVEKHAGDHCGRCRDGQ